MRPIQQYNWLKPESREPVYQIWIKANGAMLDDLRIHTYMLAYISDFHLLPTALLPHGISHWHPNFQIAEIMLKEVFVRIAQKGIQLEVTDRFRTRLIDEGYNPTYGARPLRRAVMRLLEDNLAEEVLSEKITTGDIAVVDIGPDNKVRILLDKQKVEESDPV